MKEYLVRSIAGTLNIRSGPGTQYKLVGTIKDQKIYTIVETTKDNWGKLKDNEGWVTLAYTKKI